MTLKPLTQEQESDLLNQNTVQPYQPKHHLSIAEDEAKYLNSTAQFIFQHLLHKVITHFLTDSELELDKMYSENAWDKNGRLLFKYLYFAVSDAAQARMRSRNSRLLCLPVLSEVLLCEGGPLEKEHEKRLADLSETALWQGWPLKRLQAHGVLTFRAASEDTTKGRAALTMGGVLALLVLCRTVLQGQTTCSCGNGVNGSMGNDDDPFKGIERCRSQALDLSEGKPAMMLNGYDQPLHEDMMQEAKVFMQGFFDATKHDPMQAIKSEAKKYADKKKEIETVLGKHT